MKKLIKVLAIIIAAATVYSFLPAAVLYLRTSPALYTNEEAVGKLVSNKGDYFEFIVMADDHAGLVLDDSAALKLVRNINRESRFNKVPIDFVEITGDITFRGSVWDYAIFNKIRSLVKMPVVCAMGNHDNDKDNGELFKRYAGKNELSFADRNSYFVMINNGSNDITEKQFSYLEEELKRSATYTHRFVFMHKSPAAFQQSWYRPELSPWSYRLMKLCEKYKVDMVFSGHEHMFKHGSYGGVKYITSGGGGIITHIPADDGGFLHYVVVKVYGDYVDYEVRRIFPPLWEFFAYYMWKDAFYLLKGILL